MEPKWFRYTVDYEYGMAHVYSRERLVNPLVKFNELASEMFGIRKSIGETKLLDEELIAFDGKGEGPKETDANIMAMGMGDLQSTMLQMAVRSRVKRDFDLPSEQLARVAFILSHGGDVACFSAGEYPDRNGYKQPWKLKYEGSDEWCTCDVEGKPELKCEVHHFWTFDHDQQCKCNVREESKS